ncbi:class I adenylate-forming enzyme family protein [Amycolatopsis decaplanina]|uniref:AMP-dependent synthetase and ligase n=1 Tax=Amycolatopsis decaplanina DSM 44594 TaxID=1284240 RepID=M2YTS9_9PSEU|nr:class I adenylate-forming enzyme family protein [Amycolatopsis decaplanina]EME51754.1 AMP-dependent synthetase and ligase [Amycolatopsis decaplanina DSM 44594]
MSTDTHWVDDLLLSRSEGEFRLGRSLPRSLLREEVGIREEMLRGFGVGPASSVAMRLPPCAEFITIALAAWRCGARLILVDHRVPDFHWERTVEVYGASLTFSSGTYPDGRTVCLPTRLPGGPRTTGHALIQFSSGSTGDFKGIGRHVDDIVAEVTKSASVDGAPMNGEDVVVLTAFAHAYGLFAGLLTALYTGANLIVPDHGTALGIVRTLRGATRPTSVFGVPFHLQMLATVPEPPALPHFERFVWSGEAAPASVCDLVADRYRTRVGQLYGMTETGMISADLDGLLRPSAGVLAPGMEARADHGELLVRLRSSPYVPELATRQGAWQDGWLHTGDAATIDLDGQVHLEGRVDSQVAVGGLKVDLMALERIFAAIEGVRDVVVIHRKAIHAYLVLDVPDALPRISGEADKVLAPHQRPAAYHVVPSLPKTPTGKRIRDPERLSSAAMPTERAIR